MCVSALVCLHCKGCYAILLLLKRVVAMSIHERIREIRQALGLSQAKFAKDISISSGYVAGLELGNRKVNDRMIKLICTQYNVNEAWLRDGTGEMFRSASDSRLERIIALFHQLEPAFQDYVLEQTDRLLALQNRRAQEDHTQNN